MTKTTGPNLGIRIDTELKKEFLKKCIDNDTTPTELLTKYIEKYVGKKKEAEKK